MTESPKLLPCPFCGGTDIRQSIATDAIYRGTRLYCVECSSSVVYWGGPAFRPRATALWNRRAPDPEREAMAKVCEAAKARMDTYDKGEDYTGGIKSVEWNNLRDALAELERARKGDG